MESKNTFILHETEAFMRGELDNVTVAHGRIVLDLVSGGVPAFQLTRRASKVGSGTAGLV